jgi:hypothetical protein
MIDDYSPIHEIHYISMIATCQEMDQRYNKFAIDSRRGDERDSDVDERVR